MRKNDCEGKTTWGSSHWRKIGPSANGRKCFTAPDGRRGRAEKNENTNLNSSKWPHVISGAWTWTQRFRNFQSHSFCLSIPPSDLQKKPSRPIHNHNVTKSRSHALNRSLQFSLGHMLTAWDDLGYCAMLPVVFLSLLVGFPALSLPLASLFVSLSLSRKWRTQAPPYGYDHPPFSASLVLFFFSSCPLFSALSVSSCLTNTIPHYSAKNSLKTSQPHTNRALHPQISICCEWAIKKSLFFHY